MFLGSWGGGRGCGQVSLQGVQQLGQRQRVLVM